MGFSFTPYKSLRWERGTTMTSILKKRPKLNKVNNKFKVMQPVKGRGRIDASFA
jgi:hypothetical protein